MHVASLKQNFCSGAFPSLQIHICQSEISFFFFRSVFDRIFICKHRQFILSAVRIFFSCFYLFVIRARSCLHPKHHDPDNRPCQKKQTADDQQNPAFLFSFFSHCSFSSLSCFTETFRKRPYFIFHVRLSIIYSLSFPLFTS